MDNSNVVMLDRNVIARESRLIRRLRPTYRPMVHPISLPSSCPLLPGTLPVSLILS